MCVLLCVVPRVRYKPWWYTHCEDICRAGEEVVEYVPLRHYILRHNRAIFWTLQDMIPPWFGNHWLFRYTFGWMIPPAISFLKFTTTAEFRHLTFSKQVFQDIVLPMTELETALDFADDLFGIMPVLIYPCVRVWCRTPLIAQPVHPLHPLHPPRPGLIVCG
jgi:delta24-sterol reductase